MKRYCARIGLLFGSMLMALAGNLIADLTLKDSRPFRKELERIIAEVF